MSPKDEERMIQEAEKKDEVVTPADAFKKDDKPKENDKQTTVLLDKGDRAAWKEGDFPHLFKDGSYRNKWYSSGLPSGAFCAIGGLELPDGQCGHWILQSGMGQVSFGRCPRFAITPGG